MQSSFVATNVTFPCSFMHVCTSVLGSLGVYRQVWLRSYCFVNLGIIHGLPKRADLSAGACSTPCSARAYPRTTWGEPIYLTRHVVRCRSGHIVCSTITPGFFYSFSSNSSPNKPEAYIYTDLFDRGLVYLLSVQLSLSILGSAERKACRPV